MVQVGFWINDPSKIGFFHQHWEKLCWNAAVWRPCGQISISFLLPAYFCEKNLELGVGCSFRTTDTLEVCKLLCRKYTKGK